MPRHLCVWPPGPPPGPLARGCRWGQRVPRLQPCYRYTPSASERKRGSCNDQRGPSGRGSPLIYLARAMAGLLELRWDVREGGRSNQGRGGGTRGQAGRRAGGEDAVAVALSSRKGGEEVGGNGEGKEDTKRFGLAGRGVGRDLLVPNKAPRGRAGKLTARHGQLHIPKAILTWQSAGPRHGPSLGSATGAPS